MIQDTNRSVISTRAGTVTETRYAKSGQVSIAYQVVGDGALDLVLVPGWVSHVEAFWEEPGCDHFFWVGDTDAPLGEIEEFLTGVRRGAESDRVLATVLFTDIVGSTAQAAKLGDSHWRSLLERYYDISRREVEHFGGREVNTTGDGHVATFDGPARAIHCARAVRDAIGNLGIRIRAGLHTGECELVGDQIGGIAVHIGARVASKADPDEILVSNTVKDLVIGSGLHFSDRGSHALKGVPGEWRLFAADV